MDIDYTPYFERYEALSALADQLFNHIASESPDCVACKPFCADCCHAVFDLTFIEALYIHQKFYELFSGAERESILEKANRADREVYRLKRAAFKSVASGELSESQVLERLSRERVRCPLLNDRQMCDLYDFRPITCRLYGVPTVIGGKAHVCGASTFKVGEKCQTVNIDGFQNRMIELSNNFALDIGSRYKLADLLVPVSMAILTDYDESYLGLRKSDAEAAPAEGIEP